MSCCHSADCRGSASAAASPPPPSHCMGATLQLLKRPYHYGMTCTSQMCVRILSSGDLLREVRAHVHAVMVQWMLTLASLAAFCLMW
jgi:hypothetical protein